MEIQRMGNIAPTGLNHVATKSVLIGRRIYTIYLSFFRDVTVNGFTIPANTMIFGLYAEILKVRQSLFTS